MNKLKAAGRSIIRNLGGVGEGAGLHDNRRRDLEAQVAGRVRAEREYELAMAARLYGRIPEGADVLVEVEEEPQDLALQLDQERAAAPQPEQLVQEAVGAAEGQVAVAGGEVQAEDGAPGGELLRRVLEAVGVDDIGLLPEGDLDDIEAAVVAPEVREPEDVLPPGPLPEGDAAEQGGRLRPRGRVLNEAADDFWGYLVGERDRDRPGQILGVVGQPSARLMTDWFKDLFWGRAKLVAIRRVRVHDPRDDIVYDRQVGDFVANWDEPHSYDYFATVRVGGASDVIRVSLRLLARMVCFMAFRPRDTTSLQLLRSRAAQMAKDLGLSPEQLAWVLHGTITCAVMTNNREVVSLRVLEGRRGDEVVDWSVKTSTGLLREGGAHYWGHIFLLVGTLLVGIWHWLPASQWWFRVAIRYGLSYYFSYPWLTLYSGLLLFLVATIPKYHVKLVKA